MVMCFDLQITTATNQKKQTKTSREMNNSGIEMLRSCSLLVEILPEKPGLAIFKKGKWYVFKINCLLG